jgi:hypothetical protein
MAPMIAAKTRPLHKTAGFVGSVCMTIRQPIGHARPRAAFRTIRRRPFGRGRPEALLGLFYRQDSMRILKPADSFFGMRRWRSLTRFPPHIAFHCWEVLVRQRQGCANILGTPTTMDRVIAYVRACLRQSGMIGGGVSRIVYRVWL